MKKKKRKNNPHFSPYSILIPSQICNFVTLNSISILTSIHLYLVQFKWQMADSKFKIVFTSLINPLCNNLGIIFFVTPKLNP